jgi:hypothetical protein
VPGDSPYQAVEAFLEPLQRALSCLGSCKIITSPGGKQQISKVHAWNINSWAGLTLPRIGVFRAVMHYEIVLSDAQHEGTWRVTTRAYAYGLTTADGQELWSLHWHPVGQSPVTFPHAHLPALNAQGHFPTERMTLEQSVRWCIESGATPARTDWEPVLAETEGIHKLYRTWADVPPSA